jgi:hypothetical protein
MKRIIIMAAFAASLMAAEAKAAYIVDIGTVPVSGTLTTGRDGYDCFPSSCPPTVTPYASVVSGAFSKLILETFPTGLYQFTVQDGHRRFSNVTLDFRSSLLSSLTGFDEIQRCSSLPCTYSFAQFRGGDFPVTVTDTVTGVSRVFTPVPEPTTWLLMLFGFAAIGSALRARQTRRSERLAL